MRSDQYLVTRVSLRHALMQAASLLSVLFTLGLSCLDVQAQTLPARFEPGAGRFEIQHDGRSLPVWYFRPEKTTPDTPILIVMHGVNRDADRYRNEWMPHAQKHGFILAAPEFSEKSFPGTEGYSLEAKGAFGFIEPVFDAVKAATGNRSDRYHLYGHSAGAQFVHRYLYFVPQARVAKAVAANAGWWTMPDLTVDFPYGLKGSPIQEDSVKAMLQRPLVVLLGTADTDPNHKNLRRTPEAMLQGPHRFARGQTFFATGKKQAAKLGVSLGWQLATAPGVPHSDAGMSAFAVQWLFGQPAITGRDPQHVRVLFGGDTSGGESYQEQYPKEGGVNILTEKGYEYGLTHLKRLLSAADFNVINLETPLTTRRESPLKSKDYLHYSDPVKLPALFAPYAPLAFSLANNHTLDHGPEGLDETFAALTTAGMATFGTGNNLASAEKPLLQELRIGGKSATLAIFGAFEYRKDYDQDFHFYAGEDKPGCAPVDVPGVKKAIADLRRNTPDAFVVYFVHWGGNYLWKNEEQTTTAHALREAGVDLVIGHGAHLMQEVEHDGKGWIFYSIGNLLFNARGRYAANHAPPFSLPLVADFSMKDDKLQTSLRVYPIVSDNQLTNYQPRFVTETELSAVDAMLADKSAWNAAARAAVKRGADDVGPYLEFGTPK
ncbi:CapA family protein [Brevifollis gellanilyticus]|nr:CapA family protein [Brevifollis gellanilyticus]